MDDTANRRSFLMGSAAALGASALKAAEGNPIRVAFIGVGNRGGSLLQQTLRQENVSVAAICDTNPDKRDTALGAAAKFSPRSFTEWRKLIDLQDVDAVFIATPCDLHAEMAAAALTANKYVYCEKPLGIYPQEVDKVLQASRRSQAFLQIGQQMRYYPWLAGSIPHIHQGIVGKVLVVKAQRHSTPRGKDALPEWYFDVKRSGDRIVENGVHNLDVCNWIINSRPVAAFGYGAVYMNDPKPPGTEYMDAYSVMYQYENNVNLTYSEAQLHPRGLKELANGSWYVVFGEKGAVTIKSRSGLFYEMQAAGEPRELLTPPQQETKENAIGEFFSAIREKRQPFAGITVAATAALTTIMGREAIYRKKMVTWKELGVTV
jgi:myo-inositol 2-dehydrogenase / D-chiro-inositol 1-dehydrogenase